MDAESPRNHPVLEAARAARARVLSGLLLALPIAITAWVFYWFYTTLRKFLLDPSANVVRWLLGPGTVQAPPAWWDSWIAPVLGALMVLSILYVLGYFARSRASQAIDWVLFRVPLVTIVYKAVRNVFQSLGREGAGNEFRRVVLVPFPHPGSKAIGFVTRSLKDTRTGKPILCVSVLTGVVPPAGFTLFLPEEDVTEIDWSVNQALQAILSGGITAPPSIHFSRTPTTPNPEPATTVLDNTSGSPAPLFRPGEGPSLSSSIPEARRPQYPQD